MTENNKTREQIEKAEKPKTLNDLLRSDDFRNSLAAVVPKHLTADRMVKMALVAASRQPKLAQCNIPSVLQAIMKATELGLDCTGTLGQAYLVPFFNSKINQLECQFMIGYQGLMNLARRSGDVEKIESQIVREKDYFVLEYGLKQTCVHRPYLKGDPGEILGAYAVAKIKGNNRLVEYMSKEQIDGIRARSKAGNLGPWVTDYPEMARKTVVRRLCKYLPLSPELQTAVEADDQQYDFAEFRPIITQEPELGVNGLKARLKAQQAPHTINEAEDKAPKPREHKPHRGRPKKLAETPQEPQSHDDISNIPAQEQIEPATANHCSYCHAIVPGNEVEIDTEGAHRTHCVCGYELDNQPLETESETPIY